MRLSMLYPLIAGCLFAAVAAEKPLPVTNERTARYRWLNKPVLESRLLDQMEDLGNWSLENRGEGNGEMTLTSERARDGAKSLRLRAKTMGAKPGRTVGRPPGTASVIRRVEGEDWNKWNRVSFWVYPDLPGFRVVSLLVLINNAGVKPDSGWRDRGDFVLLKNREWNHVVSEFPHVARDKVTGVQIMYRLQGSEPGATDTAAFDFDQMELQRVEADYFEGWGVWPGRIAFSHTGYQPGTSKTAMAGDLRAREFKVVRQEDGTAVLSRPVKSVKGPAGEFQVLDFSDVREPGTYVLRAAEAETQPFRIGNDVWRDTILKAINFFYAERCGYAVPGVHDVCHRDWQGVHGEKRVNINGGWHDAGDLSQGLVNTSQAVYYMFSLAEKLKARDPELAARLVEEGTWGLDWVLKTTFHDGYRVTWATMDFWTNGVLGDADDVVSEARRGPYESFLAAAAEGIAYRVLRHEDPELAAHSLKTAREDWQFAVEALNAADGRFAPVEVASMAVQASLELFRATGERLYAEKGVQMAHVVTESQQRSFLPGVEAPLAGFFYTGPDRKRILHYFHVGQQQLPMAALRGLCETFPEHGEWMKWYSAVALHSEYLKMTAKYAAPYGMLPASLYRDDEHLAMPEARREFFRTQVLKGTKLGANYYLRMFPVWMTDDFRGNLGVILSAAKAASEASHLRGDLESAEVAQRQLEWTVGRNPFAQSLMYGEGYDYAPQYTAMSGDIAGSLPVGIQTRFDRDVPYNPPANWPTWKEVWVLPVSRWFALMRDLSGAAVVDGRVAPANGEPVQFREKQTGYSFRIRPDYGTGRFRAKVPQGRYEVSAGVLKTAITVLPGGSYDMDLRPGRLLDYEVSSETDRAGSVSIAVTASGEGTHTFALRADNLAAAQPERTVNLKPGVPVKLTWQGKLASDDSPWVAVVVPDGDIDRRQEAFGMVRR